MEFGVRLDVWRTLYFTLNWLFLFFFCLKNNQYKNIVLSFLALLLVSLHSSLLVEVLFFFFNELMFNLISLVSFLSGAG